MNEQKPPGMIEWTRIKNPDGTTRKGFTWSPVAGCLHGCRWHMRQEDNLMFEDLEEEAPETAICYAELIANSARLQRSYPKGFEHIYWHPERLGQPKKMKEPAGIFLDAMSDAMGVGVKEEWIEQVLDVCRETPWHNYQLLTKNAPRLLKFDFPENIWIGVSSSPDILMGKEMDAHRKQRYMNRALEVLSQIDVPVRWISFEPLNQDYSEVLDRYPNVIQWAVVGAASNGRKYYPPRREDFEMTMGALNSQSIPVFYKGNMSSLQSAKNHWREEFPGE